MSAPWLPMLLAAVGGAGVESALLWAVLRRPGRWAWQAENYQGTQIPTAVGLLIVLPAALVVLVAASVMRADSGRLLALLGAVLVCFGLLGLQDDLATESATKGLLGHLRMSLARRCPTSGAVKAFGGAVVGVWAAATLNGHLGWEALVGGAVVALSANDLNALDKRPGRAGKAFVALAVPLAVVAACRHSVLGPALLGLAAAGAVYLPGDLRRRVMLGDAGANPLGAALGLVVVALTGTAAQAVLVAALLAFSLAADRFSLTALIERTPPLAWLNRLGTEGSRSDATDPGHPA